MSGRYKKKIAKSMTLPFSALSQFKGFSLWKAEGKFRLKSLRKDEQTLIQQ